MSNWATRAKCRGLDPNIFIPDGPGGSLEPVKAICNGTHDGSVCPVRDECWAYGEEHNMIGVWGGRVRSSRTWLSSSRSKEVKMAEPVQSAKPIPVTKKPPT